MNRTFTLLFFIVKSKQRQDSTVPIYIRITIDGQRAEIATKKYTTTEQWNQVAQKVTGNSENDKSTNARLKSLDREIHNMYNELVNKNEKITAYLLKDRLMGKDDKVRMLVPIFEYHNKQIAELVNRQYAPATLKRYNTSLQHVINFMKFQYSKADINIKELDHQFIADYDFYMRSVKKLQQQFNSQVYKKF